MRIAAVSIKEAVPRQIPDFLVSALLPGLVHRPIIRIIREADGSRCAIGLKSISCKNLISSSSIPGRKCDADEKGALLCMANVLHPSPKKYELTKIEWLLELLRLKDLVTYTHCMRVAGWASLFSVYLQLSIEEAEQLVIGCRLHDIGKLFISNGVLGQTTPLDEREWALIRHHPARGAALAELVGVHDPVIIATIREHHERWNGGGYPEKLAGSSISFHARICAVLDAFDCMTHGRSYRSRISWQECERELLAESDRQFDGAIVTAFLQMGRDHCWG